MVVTTLPRILGNGEEVTVPVNVFAMEDAVKSANVKITVDGPADVVGEPAKTVSFPEKGDQLVRFGLKATGEGVAHVTIDASGAGHKATETIALTIQNPNPEIATVQNFQLAAGAPRRWMPAKVPPCSWPASLPWTPVACTFPCGIMPTTAPSSSLPRVWPCCT